MTCSIFVELEFPRPATILLVCHNLSAEANKIARNRIPLIKQPDDLA